MAEGNSRVAWCLPPLSKGSGGLNTIFRNAEALSAAGYNCDFYFLPDMALPISPSELEEQIREWYDCRFPFQVFINATALDGDYVLAIATHWPTAYFVAASEARGKAYFVQDWEPSFYPVGETALDAAATYDLGLVPITIGKWLATKCQDGSGAPAFQTCFGADRKIYKPLGIAKERAVCAIYQPEKPRRASRLLLRALEIFSEIHPDVVVYLYGSDSPAPNNKFVQLGLLSKAECNELYNKCICGVSVSTTNPSRIPFEMMAAGLPVVDLFAPNTLYDFPESAVLLAMPNAASLATAVARYVDESALCASSTRAGLAFMDNCSLAVEQAQFVDACGKIISGGALIVDDQVLKPQVAPVLPGNRERELLDVHREKELFLTAEKCAPLILESNMVRVGFDAGETYQAVKVAVWSRADQGDLVWLDMKLRGARGSEHWVSEPVQLGVDDSLHKFIWHVYAVKREGEPESFIGGVEKNLTLSNVAQGLPSSSPELKLENGATIHVESAPPSFRQVAFDTSLPERDGSKKKQFGLFSRRARR